MNMTREIRINARMVWGYVVIIAVWLVMAI
jgi:hypothetical protein